MNLIYRLMSLLVVCNTSIFVYAAQPEAPGGRAIQFNNLVVLDGWNLVRTAIGRDDSNTVMLMSKLSTGDEIALPISKVGVVKDLKWFRGWPYLLNKRGQVLTIDPSWRRILLNRKFYLVKRGLTWSLPLSAVGGALVYGITLLDQSTLGLIASHGILPGDATWGMVITYICGDSAYASFCKSPRSIHHIGNLFTLKIATNIQEMRYFEHEKYRDLMLVKNGSDQPAISLSTIKSSSVGSSTCVELLAKRILP